MDATLSQTASAAPSAPSRGEPRRAKERPRISGIDFARFLALIGMMAAHVWTLNADGTPGFVNDVVSGKAAALFAVLAGVGITLTSRRDLATGRVWAARRNLFGRGLALVLIGLTLGTLSTSGVVVILVYYGVLFWAAALLLRWSSRALLIGAVALAVVWPILSLWLRTGLEQPFELGSASWSSFAEPLSFARGLFLTGTYPVSTWIVYAMIGMVVGRLVMAATDTGALRRLGLRLAVTGVLLSTAAWSVSTLLAGPFGGLATLKDGYPGVDSTFVDRLFYDTGMGATVSGNPWWLASPAPHTGTTFDLGITAGIALAAIGLCLVLGTALGEHARRVLEPVRRAGSAPLTVYTVHVLATGIGGMVLLSDGAAAAGETIPWYFSSGQLWALHLAGAVLLGTVLALLNRRGPLETFVSWSGRLFSRAAKTPTASS